MQTRKRQQKSALLVLQDWNITLISISAVAATWE